MAGTVEIQQEMACFTCKAPFPEGEGGICWKKRDECHMRRYCKTCYLMHQTDELKRHNADRCSTCGRDW